MSVLAWDFKHIVLRACCWIVWNIRLIKLIKSLTLTHKFLALFFHTFLGNRFDFSFKNIFEHLICQRYGVIFEPVNSVSALLDNFCDKLLCDALDHAFVNHSDSLNCDVGFILLIVDMLNRFFDNIDNKIVASLIPLSTELNTVFKHSIDHAVDHFFGCLFVQPLILFFLEGFKPLILGDSCLFCLQLSLEWRILLVFSVWSSPLHRLWLYLLNRMLSFLSGVWVFYIT